jgi:hypothetical protein
MSAQSLSDLNCTAATGTEGRFYHGFVTGLSRCLSRVFAKVDMLGQESDQLPEFGRRRTACQRAAPSLG